MTVKEDTTIDPRATKGLKWWMKCTDKKERERLLKKAYGFNMPLIYLYQYNSNEMRTDLAKAYGNGHDNYPHNLEEMCNMHQTIY